MEASMRRSRYVQVLGRQMSSTVYVNLNLSPYAGDQLVRQMWKWVLLVKDSDERLSNATRDILHSA